MLERSSVAWLDSGAWFSAEMLVAFYMMIPMGYRRAENASSRPGRAGLCDISPTPTARHLRISTPAYIVGTWRSWKSAHLFPQIAPAFFKWEWGRLVFTGSVRRAADLQDFCIGRMCLVLQAGLKSLGFWSATGVCMCATIDSIETCPFE